jgi:hypothetical protein
VVQGDLKTVGNEVESVEKVALAGPVPSDQDGEGAQRDIHMADALIIPDADPPNQTGWLGKAVGL